jgi:hypothetical protein
MMSYFKANINIQVSHSFVQTMSHEIQICVHMNVYSLSCHRAAVELWPHHRKTMTPTITVSRQLDCTIYARIY